jgi:hypothetical protein
VHGKYLNRASMTAISPLPVPNTDEEELVVFRNSVYDLNSHIVGVLLAWYNWPNNFINETEWEFQEIMTSVRDLSERLEAKEKTWRTVG